MNWRWVLVAWAIGVRVSAWAVGEELVWPGEHWASRTPAEVGLAAEKLDALGELVGGRGCVVCRGYMVYIWGDPGRVGDVASAMKPVISTLMLLAVQEGRIGSVDDPIARFEPRLGQINNGKDAAISWRHLASQTSGYGLVERPGEAYAYNDYALALYYDTLMSRVYCESGTEVLRSRLGGALQFEDPCTFEVFGPKDRPGRLGISVRDFARFGLLYLRGGRWRDRPLLRPELIKLAIGSPISAEMPLTSGKEADMLPGQRSIGGGKNITSEGPGYYSFNWWTNGKNRRGERLFGDLPADAFIASGHGARREMIIIPAWDLIVVWNESQALEENRPRQNQAMRLIRQAVGR